MASILDDSMSCGACQLNLSVGEEYLQCMAPRCGKLYHHQCNNKVLCEAEKAVWVCPECSCAAKRGGRNCDTPVGTPVNIKNVVFRNPSSTGAPTPPQPAPRRASPRSPGSDVSVSMPIASEIMLLREQITNLTEQLTDAVSTMTRYHSALIASISKVHAISDKLEALDKSMESRCSRAVVPTFSGVLQGLTDENVGARATHSRREHGSGGDTGGMRGGAMSAAARPDDTDRSSSDGGGDAGREWQEVLAKKKKQKRPTSIRCTGGPSITALRAVESRKHIHLWNMVSSAEEVKAYLEELCERHTCTVEELKSRGNYKSFKLGVPDAFYDKCLSADVWPDNARIKMWFFRRQPSKT